MSETVVGLAAADDPQRPADRFGRALYRICEVAALCGSAALLALTATAVVSIVGRSCCARPLPGDYELAQILVAIAVVACLPYCQMRGGNVLIDFFTARLSGAVRGLLNAIGAGSIGLIGAVLAWRMSLGLLELRQANDTTMILEIPSWYAYLVVIPCFALLALAGFYTAWRHLRPART